MAGEISIVKSTPCGGRGWTFREIWVTGSLTPNSFDTKLPDTKLPGFVEELEAKFQIRLCLLPPGPPAKKPAQSQEAKKEVSRHAGQSG